MSEEEAIKILKKAKKPYYTEVVGSDWIKGYTTVLGTEVDKAIDVLLTAYQKEKRKNKELEEQLRKANEYIRNEMYIDDNPTICEDEEDTITELPISLNLYNEGLRELLKLLEEGDK